MKNVGFLNASNPVLAFEDDYGKNSIVNSCSNMTITTSSLKDLIHEETWIDESMISACFGLLNDSRVFAFYALFVTLVQRVLLFNYLNDVYDFLLIPTKLLNYSGLFIDSVDAVWFPFLNTTEFVWKRGKLGSGCLAQIHRHNSSIWFIAQFISLSQCNSTNQEFGRIRRSKVWNTRAAAAQKLIFGWRSALCPAVFTMLDVIFVSQGSKRPNIRPENQVVLQYRSKLVFCILEYNTEFVGSDQLIV